MRAAHADFETYSGLDLKKVGLDTYAKDPSTGVHCLAFAFDDEEPVVWNPYFDSAAIGSLLLHVEQGGLFYAHNAAFELSLWNNVMVPQFGWPELKPEQVRCTMAMCYAQALPGALGNAAPALGIVQRKDNAGSRIMLRWCKPRNDGSMWRPEHDPKQFAALCAYCAQDVVVERAMHKRLRELSPSEQALWVLDQKINNHGVLVDLGAIDKAVALVAAEHKRLDKLMLKATGGVVGKTTEVALLLQWIDQQGVDLPLVKDKDGKERKSLNKSSVLDALDGELPANVRAALELRKEGAKSSTAKLIAMKGRADSKGRVRGGFQFHGASTGRWAHRGIQVGNLPRPRKGIKPKDIEDMVAHMADRDYIDAMYGPVLDALADCVRATIIAPPGCDLIAMDFSAVEARVLAWLAGQESVLKIFRSHGKIYESAAADIYRVTIEDINKDQRQIGKVAILALGFGGGKGAFQAMATVYGVKVTDEEAEAIKKAWRYANQKIVQYWYDLDAAAMRALETGGVEKVGAPGRQVAFRKKGSFLWCQLPSGRLLCYPYPEIRTVMTPWGAEREALTFMTVVDPSRKIKGIPDANSAGSWKRVSTHGGTWAENITQAVARDLLGEAMMRLDTAGFDTSMHCHDEAVIEVPEDSPEETITEVQNIVTELPTWAAGLPLAAEGWRGKRYRK